MRKRFFAMFGILLIAAASCLIFSAPWQQASADDGQYVRRRV